MTPSDDTSWGVTSPDPDDLARLERDYAAAVEAGRGDRGERASAAMALATAALGLACVLPWTDHTSSSAAGRVPEAFWWAVAGLASVVIAFGYGSVRPTSRGGAGVVCLIGAAVATVAALSAVFASRIVAPGPTMALAAGPIAAVVALVWLTSEPLDEARR